MKATTACLTASLLFVSLAARAADLTFHYCKDLTADQFRRAATTALTQRRYKIDQQGSSSVTGSDGQKKIEIAMTDPRALVVRWMSGSENKNERDITNIQYAMLWALTTESKLGEVAISWCTDLTTEKFHRIALAALHGRHYAIEQDTPSSLIGAQKKYKVEITMPTPGRIVTRWVPGYGYNKNNWLDNLTRDMTWSLAL
jgi:hypothetical protein